MRDVVYQQYADAFETHWWADHRRRIVSRWLRASGMEADGTHSVLEIGSGAGTGFGYLKTFGPVTGVEISKTGLALCRPRGYANLIEGDLNQVELPAESFDLAVDFHVLYHEWIKDPVEVLKRMRAALKPGGRLIVTEPAYEALRRGHDEAVMAARRWNRGDLVRMVQAAGFEVERCGGFLTLLMPAVLLSLLIDRIRPTEHEVDELRGPTGFVDWALRSVMAVERLLMRIAPLPTGTCWALIARKA